MIERFLSGRSVLDLSTNVAGAYCARLLASMGAEVTKVEAPGAGDPIRAWPPFPEDTPDPEKSGLFLFLNAGKRSITLDITSASGKEILLKLAGQADVLVESSEPGTMAELGLGYDALHEINPRLVACSVTPFGQTGPYRRYRTTDLISFAMGGIAYVMGEPDREPLTPRGVHAGLIAGQVAAVGTLIAAFHAGLTGEGQHVDISMMEAIVSCLENSTTAYEYSGAVRKRVGAKRSGHYVDILQAKNGEFGVNTTTPQMWEAFCRMVGMPELIADPRFATPALRGAQAREISEIVGPWFAVRSKEEIFEASQAAHISAGILRTVEDVFNSPQNLARGYFQGVESESLGHVRLPSLPFREAGGSAVPLGPAPELGEHNAEVYQAGLGLSADDIVALRRAGTI